MDIDVIRIIIFVIQAPFIFLGFFLIYLILKRKKTKLTRILAIFFFLPSLALLLPFIAYLIAYNPLSFFLYNISVYFMINGPLFLLYFTFNLYSIRLNLSKTYDILLMFPYLIISLISLIVVDGISYDASTNWSPVYTWELLFAFYLLIGIYSALPQIFLFKNLNNVYSDVKVNKKLHLFYFGSFTFIIQLYLIGLYNTWNNEFFKLIWPFISLIMTIIGYLFIYRGVGIEN